MRHVVQGAKTWGAALLAVLAVAPGARAGGADLPVALSREGDHEGAALEFRRLAMDTGESAGRGAFYWAAAHEYWQAGRYELADRMLDNAENARRDLEAPVLLLRGQNALSDGAWSEAAFYLQDAVSRTADDDFRELAARRLAVARLRQK
ncbi:MAG: hypothetical protein JXB04_04730, partial [Kiritimatiellae bacterium]|nr:hypothetical protein [Kiritimatiellia bacterium]